MKGEQKEAHYYSGKIEFGGSAVAVLVVGFFDIHRNFFFSLKTHAKKWKIMIKEKSGADVH